MKNYNSMMKRLILLSLTIIAIYSCNHKTDKVTIDYRISGQNWMANTNDSTRKTLCTHSRNDKIIVDHSILNNPNLVTSINWKDSTTVNKIVNGGANVLSHSIRFTTLKVDTFYIHEENEEIKTYIVSGKTESKYLSTSQESDSLHYLIHGTFNDTIQIKNESKDDAEKMAFNIIHKTLYEIINDEIKKEVEKIARHS